MPFRQRFPTPRGPSLLLVLLLGTLVLAGALAYQAHDAARSHRATAERALRDYAAIAAWDYSLHVKEKMYSVLAASFEPLEKVSLVHDAPLPPPSVIARSASEASQCPTEAENAARYYFRVNLRDGTAEFSGAPVPASLRGWVADTVAQHARTTYGREWVYALIHGQPDGQARTLAYTLKRDPSGEPIAAYGYESCMGVWGVSVFAKVMQHYQLLPPTVMGEVPNDSLFSAVVSDTRGHVLYQSPRQFASTFSAEHALQGSYGGLVFRVALSPEAASALVIGGLPRDRVPLLLGLFALTAGLLGITVHQLRRETELSRLRADFISSVSHELRTPLAQIRMFAETLLLDRVRSAGERRRSLEIIDQEARRLTHLVGNVLQFARAERRLTRLSPESTDLTEQIRETLEVFAPLAQARRVQLRPELADGVTGDVDRCALRQMLLNLLDNAVKYGPTGQTVTVGLGRHAGTIRLWVADQGPGISPRDRKRIWAPFYRRERDANSAVAGSGIGLAVVRELTDLHGGRAWVEEAPGGGARFIVQLPDEAGEKSPRIPPRAPGAATREPVLAGHGAEREG